MFVGAYPHRTGDDEGEQASQEAGASGQGAGCEIRVWWLSDPDSRLPAGFGRDPCGWGRPARAPALRGADRTRGGARWGGASHRALVPGTGTLALHAEGVGDFVDRRDVAGVDLPRVLLPRAAPDRTAHDPREEHTAHRQQGQPVLARRHRRAQRAPAGAWLRPGRIRQATRYEPFRSRPDPYGEF